MTTTTPLHLVAAGLRVAYWPRRATVYVEAQDDSGRVVLAVEWTPEGAGEVTTDEVDDVVSDEVYRAVMAAYQAHSRRN